MQKTIVSAVTYIASSPGKNLLCVPAHRTASLRKVESNVRGSPTLVAPLNRVHHQEMNMNIKKEFRYHAESKHAPWHHLDDGEDFNANRVDHKLKSKARRDSGNRPEGNDEYEQMIAENINFGVHHMIEEAAFFIAEQRGFAPGNEFGDWLQAEKGINFLLHGTASDSSMNTADDHVMKSMRTEI